MNEHVLQRQHKELGINYVSLQSDGRFNDSEALVYDIARVLEGQKEELTAEGSIAFIVIKRNNDGKPTTLFFGRNSGNPLKMKRTKHSLTLSSQGEGKDIDTNKLYSYDYETGELTERYLYIPYYRATSSYGYNSGYSGYGSGYNGNNYCRPAWDREEDEDELSYYEQISKDDYIVDQYLSKRAKSVIKAGDWIPRTGTESAIRRELLEEAGGDFMQAAIDALTETEDADREETRINVAIGEAFSAEDYDDYSEYWCAVNAYKMMMANIAQQFEDEALKIESKQTILLTA